MTKKVRLALLTAADIIYAGNWTQGKDSTKDGSRYCMEGAIAAALGEVGYQSFHECSDAVRRVLSARLSETLSPAIWNDKRGRTAKEVGLVLYEAASQR